MPTWDQGTLLGPVNPVHLRDTYWKASPRRVLERCMKKRIATAALIGAIVGALWVMVLGEGHSSGPSSASVWNAMMWATCPAIGTIRATWWLVPVLNSILYAAIALLVLFVRKFIRPFAK
jgi:hypothetical protein